MMSQSVPAFKCAIIEWLFWDYLGAFKVPTEGRIHDVPMSAAPPQKINQICENDVKTIVECRFNFNAHQRTDTW